MTWWLKARRLWALVATFAAALGVGVLLGDLAIPPPVQLIRVDIPPQLVYVLPVAVAVAVAAVLPSVGDAGAESDSVRGLAWRDAILVATLTVATVASAKLLHLLAGWSLWAWFSRNTIGYVGVVLVARVVLTGRLAGIAAVVATVVLPAVLGRRWDGTVRWWAWPIAEAATLGVYVQVFAFFVTGVTVLALGIREGAAFRRAQRPLRPRPGRARQPVSG